MHDIFVERQKLLPLRHCIISSLEPETEQMFTLGNHNPSITCDIRTSCSFLSLDLSSLFVFGCNSSSSSCCPLLRFLLHPLNFHPLLFHVTGKGKGKGFSREDSLSNFTFVGIHCPRLMIHVTSIIYVEILLLSIKLHLTLKMTRNFDQF